jgi:Fe2+ or Zn2+ uptake regulation protein
MLPIDDELNERVNQHTPFRASRHRIEFYGICDRCAGAPEGGGR